MLDAFVYCRYPVLVVFLWDPDIPPASITLFRDLDCSKGDL